MKAFLLAPLHLYLNFSLLCFLAINNELQLFKIQEQAKRGARVTKEEAQENTKAEKEKNTLLPFNCELTAFFLE